MDNFMPKKSRKKSGPKSRPVTIEGGWQRAVKKALAKGKPPTELPGKRAKRPPVDE